MKKHTDYKWYHPIKLPDGTTTIPQHDYSISWKLIERCMDWSLFQNKTVLDIGCRDGLYSLKAEQAGATSVYAIDSCMSAALVEFVIPAFNSKIEAREMSLYEIPSKTTFDIILFFGVLYHLRYPFIGLKKCLDLLDDKGVLYIETSLMTDIRYGAVPLLFCPVVGHAGYDPTSCSHFNRAGLRETLFSLGATLNLVAVAESPCGDPKVDRAFFEVRKSKPIVSEGTWNYWHGTHSAYHRPENKT